MLKKWDYCKGTEKFCIYGQDEEHYISDFAFRSTDKYATGCLEFCREAGGE